MALYIFRDNINHALSFNPASDTLFFLNTDGSARQITLGETATGLNVVGLSGSVFLRGMTLKKITTENFNFVTGKLIVGDNSASTEGDDAAQGASILTSLNGDSQLYGMGGGDTMVSGSGNDFLQGNAGADSINAGTGNDTVEGGQNDDTIVAAGGASYLQGNLGNDSITDGAGNSTLRGGQGADTIDHGTGSDLIFGDKGDDILVLNAGTRFDQVTVSGGEDDDFIDATLSLGRNDINGNQGNDTILMGVADEITIRGGAGSDSIGEVHGDAVIFGDLGNDTIVTTYGAIADRATLDGGEGDDSIDASLFVGFPIYRAGAGNDSVLGSDQADSVDGGAGDDSLEGGFGGDTLTGGSGNDTINGDAANDTITGGLGFDSMDGGLGNDVFVFAAADFIRTGVQLDTVSAFVGGAGAGDRFQLAGNNGSIVDNGGAALNVAGDFNTVQSMLLAINAAAPATGTLNHVMLVNITDNTNGELSGTYLVFDTNGGTANGGQALIALDTPAGLLNSDDFM